MDDAGFGRAALIGASEGGLLSLVFAATYPERVSHLCLFGTTACFAGSEEYPIGAAPGAMDGFLEAWAEVWGTSASPSVSLFVQSRADDAAFVKFFHRYERSCCTGTAFLEVMRLNLQLDARHVVPSVQAPTLLMHRRGDPVISIEHGRWLAEHLPEVRYLELDGADHAAHFSTDHELVLDEIETFLTGSVGAGDVDRVLATVLFTDVVGSTTRAASLGDKGWRDLLDRFDDLTGRTVARHRGRVINHTGDGHVATFDGPARAIKCAQEIEQGAKADLGVDVRAGLHTGEVELRGDNVAGIAVHLAARVAARAEAGEVIVSRTVTDLVAGSGLSFVDAGTHELKGVPGEWQLFAVAG
jgi:class 3 adenylate cyclase